MYIVSACLCGINCKYSGGNNYNEKVQKLLKEGKAILVCPEQLGGLTTPRLPAEIVEGTAEEILDGKGRVLNSKGEDVTKYFVKGAKETLEIAKMAGCTMAILKSKSPSCGFQKIYNGNFNGTLKKGNGITAELLLKNGVSVITEEEF